MKAKIDKSKDKKIDCVCYKSENYHKISFTVSDLSASGSSNWYGYWFDWVFGLQDLRKKYDFWALFVIPMELFFLSYTFLVILEYLENHLLYLCLLYLGSRYNQNAGITKNWRYNQKKWRYNKKKNHCNHRSIGKMIFWGFFKFLSLLLEKINIDCPL